MPTLVIDAPHPIGMTSVRSVDFTFSQAWCAPHLRGVGSGPSMLTLVTLVIPK